MKRKRHGFVMVVLAVAVTTSLPAHELPSGVGTQTTFFFRRDHLEIELNFGISSIESWNYLERIDQNADGMVTEDESLTFIDEWGPKLIAKMDVKINGRRPAELIIIERWDAGIQGRLLTKSLDAYYKIRCPLPPELATGGWWLHYRDMTFTDRQSTQIHWIRQLGQDPDFSYWIFEPTPIPSWGGDYQMYGRATTVFFDDEFHSDIQPGNTPIPLPSELRTRRTPQPERPAAKRPTPAPRENPERKTNPVMLWASIGVMVIGFAALIVHIRARPRQ